MIGIYKITNTINNKIYIGKSVNIKERWQQHLFDAFCSEEKWQANKRKEQTPIHKALRKYGKDAFTWEIIEECSKDELNQKEIFWINYYNSFHNGYNMTKGGDGYSNGGGENAPNAKITQQQSMLIKQKLKERWTAQQIQQLIPEATNGIISSINYGKTWFDEDETYPISIDNGHRIWSDEEALQIKQEYANGATISELAKKYNVMLGTISDLVKGKSYTNLPIIKRNVEWQRVAKNRKFTDEEVLKYRELAKTQSMLSIFNTYKPNCNYAAFRNMIKGVTYKNVGL